jgi:hypothetical protein
VDYEKRGAPPSPPHLPILPGLRVMRPTPSRCPRNRVRCAHARAKESPDTKPQIHISNLGLDDLESEMSSMNRRWRYSCDEGGKGGGMGMRWTCRRRRREASVEKEACLRRVLAARWPGGAVWAVLEDGHAHPFRAALAPRMPSPHSHSPRSWIHRSDGAPTPGMRLHVASALGSCSPPPSPESRTLRRRQRSPPFPSRFVASHHLGAALYTIFK